MRARKDGILQDIVGTFVENIPELMNDYLCNNWQDVVPRLLSRFDSLTVVTIFRHLLELPVEKSLEEQSCKPWWDDSKIMVNALMERLMDARTSYLTSEFIMTILHRGFTNSYVFGSVPKQVLIE